MTTTNQISLEHSGATYVVHTTAPLTYTFVAHGVTLNHVSDIDLHEEFGNDAHAWADLINDLMTEVGALSYDEDHGYITPEHLQEAENEAIYYAEHVRQESRSDIFV